MDNNVLYLDSKCKWSVEVRRGKTKENGERGALYMALCRSGQPISILNSNDKTSLRIALQEVDEEEVDD